MRHLLSAKEVKRLRCFIEMDWPKTNIAIEALNLVLREARYDSKIDIDIIFSDALNGALSDYRDVVYQEKVVGKIDDPLRLAVFISSLTHEVILRLNNALDSTHYDPLGIIFNNDATHAQAKENLYALFVQGTIRKKLRETGYERKVLVGGRNNLLLSATSDSYIYANWMGF